MCGIVGFTNRVDNASEILGRMMDRIKHRGPDSEGKYIDDGIAMGFRRLSIIDLSDVGSQPIFNEDRSLVLTFNGEIYNYKELREELIRAGHNFYTKTDSEVLIHGYEEWGEKLLDRLRGMFAFVIYNKNTGDIFGARDFFGIKPFYYAQMNGTFMWGSEIKSFLDHPDFKKELNTDVLETYLTFQYSPTEDTFFKNVKSCLRHIVLHTKMANWRSDVTGKLSSTTIMLQILKNGSKRYPIHLKTLWKHINLLMLK